MRPAISPQGTTDGNAQVPGNGKTTRGFEILYWDITTVAGENHTRNTLSDISRTERAVFKGNAFFFVFVLNRVNRVGLRVYAT
jgi:hypothetical protein